MCGLGGLAQAKVVCASPSTTGDTGTQATDLNSVCNPASVNEADRSVNVGSVVYNITGTTEEESAGPTPTRKKSRSGRGGSVQ